MIDLEKEMKRHLFEAYRRRLLEILSEVEVFDSEGRLLLSPGLKVRDTKSGFEYTVDRVEGTGDEAVVHLNSPEEPRLQPAKSGPRVIGGDLNPENSSIAGIKMKRVPRSHNRDSGLKLSAKDFKKQFEVE